MMALEQCCMVRGNVRCERRGEPEEGYDFFVCQDCLDELEARIDDEYLRRLIMRHINNLNMRGGATG